MNAITLQNPTIKLKGDTLTTTSHDVSEFFGRRHDRIIRAIENLECSEEFHGAHFGETLKSVVMPKGAMRQDKFYEMTEQGFTFLAMGFTGKKAAAFKEAYITTFHAMQTELLQKYKQAALPNTITPKQKLSIRDAMAKKVYDNYGKKMIPSGFKAEWHDFYEAFDISKYEELPADRFDDAMGYILGEWVPEEETFAIPDGKRLVDEGNFNAMKNRLELLNDRYTELNDINRDAYMLRMQAEALQLKILEFETKTIDPVREASMLARTLN